MNSAGSHGGWVVTMMGPVMTKCEVGPGLITASPVKDE